MGRAGSGEGGSSPKHTKKPEESAIRDRSRTLAEVLKAYKKIALGPLHLRPHEFWRSTPSEIAEQFEAWIDRDRREWERAAWIVAHVVSPHVKRPPSIARLLSFLKRRAPAQTGIQTQDEARAFVQSIAAEHKKKAWTMIKDEFVEGKN